MSPSEAAQCSDRNRNLRPFSREAELLKPEPNRSCQGANHSSRASWVYKSALKDVEPVKHKLDKGEVSAPPNSEERRSGSSGKSWWKIPVEIHLGIMVHLDAFYRQLHLTRLPADPGHSSNSSGVNWTDLPGKAMHCSPWTSAIIKITDLSSKPKENTTSMARNVWPSLYLPFLGQWGMLWGWGWLISLTEER